MENCFHSNVQIVVKDFQTKSYGNCTRVAANQNYTNATYAVRNSINIALDLGSGLDVNEWSWNVTMSLSLLPVCDALPITKQFTHLFHLEQNWGYLDFVSYPNFTKSYVKNDKVTFVVNSKVDPPKPLWNIDDEMNNLNKLF